MIFVTNTTTVGTAVDRRAKLPPQELAMRANVNDFLQHCDLMFSPVLGETAVDERMKTKDTTQTSEADPTIEGEDEYVGEVTSDNLEAPTEAQASLDVPSDGNANHAMQDVKYNSTLAEADELMQQQIRAQSQSVEGE